MIKDKKGLSQVVTIVIMVVLVLIAIGIVWAVVGNVLNKSAKDIDLGTKCLEVDLTITNAFCTTAGVCEITIQRSKTDDEIDGYRLIVVNSTNSNSTDILENIEASAKITKTFDSKLTLVKGDKAQIVAYFLDETGAKKLCQIKERVITLA